MKHTVTIEIEWIRPKGDRVLFEHNELLNKHGLEVAINRMKQGFVQGELLNPFNGWGYKGTWRVRTETDKDV